MTDCAELQPWTRSFCHPDQTEAVTLKQTHPETASPTLSRSPSARRWGLIDHHTRPSGRLSPDRTWPGLWKHPGPQKCHKDHLRTGNRKLNSLLFKFLLFLQIIIWTSCENSAGFSTFMLFTVQNTKMSCVRAAGNKAKALYHLRD